MLLYSNPFSQSQGGILSRRPQGPNPYQEHQKQVANAMLAQQKQEEYQRAVQAQGASSQNAGYMEQIASLFAKGMNPTKEETAPADQSNLPALEPMPAQDMQGPVSGPTVMNNYGIDEVGKIKPANSSELLSQATLAAKNVYPDNPLMQKVALSQAILESGLMGSPSQLATKHNNLFGIKASRSFPGTGGTVGMQTLEYVGGQPSRMTQDFATNQTLEDSFRQHQNLLSGSSRYDPVMKAANPEEAFAALQKAGYATDPNYAKKLGSIYGQYVAPLYT